MRGRAGAIAFARGASYNERISESFYRGGLYMKYGSDEMEKQAVLRAAFDMAAAARTAPKARGIDKIVCCVLDGAEKDALTAEMRRQAELKNSAIFLRDADCVDKAQAIVLIGVRKAPAGLNGCGLCGAASCTENTGACVFNITDLGIAVGSAVSVAADRRIDNRVLYTAGWAALCAGVFPETPQTVYGIPLAAYGKNIFFDRRA